MTPSGDDYTVKRKKCKYRKGKIEQDTRTSGAGRYYDHCKLTHKPCEKKNCISTGGE